MEKALFDVCNRLSSGKKFDRAYLLGKCLADQNNLRAVQGCINCALDIYKTGKKSNIAVIEEKDLVLFIHNIYSLNVLKGLEPFVPFSTECAVDFLREGITVIDSEVDVQSTFEKFIYVWGVYPHSSLIFKYVAERSAICKLIIDYFDNHVSAIKNNPELTEALLQSISSLTDFRYSLRSLENLWRKGLDVEKFYLNVTKSTFHTVDQEERLILLTQALALFKDPWLVEEKLNIANALFESCEFDKAESVFQSLISLHENAQPRLAELYLCKSKNTEDLLSKKDFLLKSYSFKKSHDQIFNQTMYDSTLDLIKEESYLLLRSFFIQDRTDEAYQMQRSFSEFDTHIFNLYKSVLLDYHDYIYSLRQLENLKEEGIDVKKEYCELSVRLSSDEAISVEARIAILSRAFSLYKDNTVEKCFYDLSINTILSKSDADALNLFKKCWQEHPSVIYFKDLLNEEVSVCKPIINYLVNETPIQDWKKTILTSFLKKIRVFNDYAYSLDILETFNLKGIDVEETYVQVIQHHYSSFSEEEKLCNLDRGLTLYKNTWLIVSKYKIAEDNLYNESLDKAEKLLTQLVPFHAYAQPLLAVVYLKYAQQSSLLDLKETQLRKAYELKTCHDEIFDKALYNEILPKLAEETLSMVQAYFTNKMPDSAYQIITEFRNYDETLFAKYLDLLVEYPDYKYVLSKLESIQSGKDNILPRYCIYTIKLSESDIDLSEKVAILSYALVLCSDSRVKSRYNELSVLLIQNQSDVEESFEVFKKCWNEHPYDELIESFIVDDSCILEKVTSFLIKDENTNLPLLIERVSSINDSDYVFDSLANLYHLGIDVKSAYFGALEKFLPEKDTEEKLRLINNALSLYPEMSLYNKKMDIAGSYLNDGDAQTAITICEQLKGIHPSSEPIMASALYELFKKQKDLGEKVNILRKGLSLRTCHNPLFDENLYNSVHPKLVKAASAMARKLHDSGQSEQAYQLCIELKAHTDKWLSIYCELKESELQNIEDEITSITFLEKTIMDLRKEIDSVN